ncbi:hypothetical protein B296_00028020 [Ensete ventricosum]|uniref:Uncharacterized protein n=1 Tax=Ensete ventricosum TaxID=4639 RepID=A0A426WYM4_ENSVE|nr:hypothetical protein B296_00028020 [Ensete ventricosum]
MGFAHADCWDTTVDMRRLSLAGEATDYAASAARSGVVHNYRLPLVVDPRAFVARCGYLSTGPAHDLGRWQRGRRCYAIRTCCSV